MARGKLVPSVEKKIEAFMGRPTSTCELRLYPYICYVMQNEQRIDPIKVNSEEREIISKWRQDGHIVGGASGLAITREFWDHMNDVLFDAYVAGIEE